MSDSVSVRLVLRQDAVDIVRFIANPPMKHCYTESIAAIYFRTLSALFSPYLIDQSSRRMGLVLACVVRILHDDWLASMGENRPDRVLKHLAAMLTRNTNNSSTFDCNEWKQYPDSRFFAIIKMFEIQKFLTFLAFYI